MGVLENLVTVDHKYCIPERSMRDNIFLIRDTNDICIYILMYIWELFHRTRRSHLIGWTALTYFQWWGLLLFITVTPLRGWLEEVHSTILDFFLVWLALSESCSSLSACGGRRSGACGHRCWGQLGYNRQLFLLYLAKVTLEASALSTRWCHPVRSSCVNGRGKIQGLWVFEEPLFYNSLLDTEMLQSVSLRTSLCEGDCTKDSSKAKDSTPEDKDQLLLFERVVAVCAALLARWRIFIADYLLWSVSWWWWV